MWTITESTASLPAIIGALWSVANADGGPSSDQRAWIEEVSRRHGVTADPSPVEKGPVEGGPVEEWPVEEGPVEEWPVEEWPVEAVAEALPELDVRRRLVRHLIMVALVDAQLGPAELERVEAFARGLALRGPELVSMRTFARGRTGALGRQLMRRSFILSMMKAIWRAEGLRGAWRIFRSVARLRSAARAARYRALGQLPPGTLGRMLYDHCRAHDFALPGERRGTPEILMFHDLGHVLTGYATDAAGEVQMVGFEAGFMGGNDAHSVTELGLYAFGVGAPIIPGVATRAGDFSVRPFLAAYARGEALRTDLRGWDAWPHMERPIEQVRTMLGVPPPGAVRTELSSERRPHRKRS